MTSVHALLMATSAVSCDRADKAVLAFAVDLTWFLAAWCLLSNLPSRPAHYAGGQRNAAEVMRKVTLQARPDISCFRVTSEISTPTLTADLSSRTFNAAMPHSLLVSPPGSPHPHTRVCHMQDLELTSRFVSAASAQNPSTFVIESSGRPTDSATDLMCALPAADSGRPPSRRREGIDIGPQDSLFHPGTTSLVFLSSYELLRHLCNNTLSSLSALSQARSGARRVASHLLLCDFFGRRYYS